MLCSKRSIDLIGSLSFLLCGHHLVQVCRDWIAYRSQATHLEVIHAVSTLLVEEHRMSFLILKLHLIHILLEHLVGQAHFAWLLQILEVGVYAPHCGLLFDSLLHIALYQTLWEIIVWGLPVVDLGHFWDVQAFQIAINFIQQLLWIQFCLVFRRGVLSFLFVTAKGETRLGSGWLFHFGWVLRLDHWRVDGWYFSFCSVLSLGFFNFTCLRLNQYHSWVV